MNYQQAFAISAAGMDVERLRVEVSALNLANAHTVSASGGVLYQPMRVMSSSQIQQVHGANFMNMVDQRMAGPTGWVEPTGATPRRVLDPGHPMADATGFIKQPNVDTAVEMMTLMSALRSYEANLAALNTTRAMLLKSLDIGGQA